MNNSQLQVIQKVITKVMGNSNPVIQNLVKMAQNGDIKGVEQFARNMCTEKGKDFDKEFNKFMSNFK